MYVACKSTHGNGVVSKWCILINHGTVSVSSEAIHECSVV